MLISAGMQVCHWLAEMNPCACCSFGVVLWELTTGRLPEGRHLREFTAADDCPASVDALMNACLSEDPSARPSAVDIVHALQDLK